MTTLADLVPPVDYAAQRAQCERCRHVVLVPLKPQRDEGRKALRCDADRQRSCSLVRTAGHACGPEAKLFQARLFPMSRRPVTMTLAEVLNLGARVRNLPGLAELRDNPAQRGKKGQKYGNTKVTADGITFDSKAEHRRWCHLRVLERAGEITQLDRQVPYELIPAQVSATGRKQRATVYLADFVYVRTKDGKVIVEDVKGAVTPEFRIKRKLMLERHGIEIQEIRS